MIVLSQLCYRPVVTYCMVYHYTKRATLARLLANEGPAIYVVHLNRYFVIPPWYYLVVTFCDNNMRSISLVNPLPPWMTIPCSQRRTMLPTSPLRTTWMKTLSTLPPPQIFHHLTLYYPPPKLYMSPTRRTLVLPQQLIQSHQQNLLLPQSSLTAPISLLILLYGIAISQLHPYSAQTSS